MQTLQTLWAERNHWAALARKHQAEVAVLQRLALIFTLAGALYETAASYYPKPAWVTLFGESYNPLGLAGAVYLLTAAYLGRHLVGDNKRQQWVNMRAAAEAMKSLCFRYATQVPPFNSNQRDAQLIREYTGIVRGVDASGVVGITGLSDEKVKQLNAQRQLAWCFRPLSGLFKARRAISTTLPAFFEHLPMPVETYLTARVLEQKNYYAGAVTKLQRESAVWRGLSMVLSWGAAVLGLLAGTSDGEVTRWIAVITTAMAAIGAHYQAQRYDPLKTGYTAAANRLDAVILTSANDIQRLVTDCESILNAENQAWIAGWERAIEENQKQQPQAENPPKTP